MRAMLCPALALSLLAGTAPQARASVQDYQIRRLLSEKSECRPVSLTLRPESGAGLHYHVDCGESALYPDGVEVACTDRQDERSCRILTSAKSFKTPNLLRSGPPPGW